MNEEEYPSFGHDMDGEDGAQGSKRPHSDSDEEGMHSCLMFEKGFFLYFKNIMAAKNKSNTAGAGTIVSVRTLKLLKIRENTFVRCMGSWNSPT